MKKLVQAAIDEHMAKFATKPNNSDSSVAAAVARATTAPPEAPAAAPVVAASKAEIIASNFDDYYSQWKLHKRVHYNNDSVDNRYSLHESKSVGSSYVTPKSPSRSRSPFKSPAASGINGNSEQRSALKSSRNRLLSPEDLSTSHVHTGFRVGREQGDLLMEEIDRVFKDLDYLKDSCQREFASIYSKLDVKSTEVMMMMTMLMIYMLS